MTDAPPARPPRALPLLEPDTRFYWEAGAAGHLLIQRCEGCARWQHPPQPRCAACGGGAVAPAPVSGRGRVATFTVNVQAWMPGLAPFVYAAVELAEQAELYVFTNILAPPEAVRSGMAVRVTFERHEDVWLPMFVPDAERAHG